ncbi:olfactory receptor 14A16-like [Tachyglossus aculeatus]|uniref:olfactory receptor 14A16-like n=1 Tax=Tachyglossus aculeatus TaxID=9261 RepID=UPI0018F77F47|nr:olfactory receptor 14A16-like [Tachyglossus aculeatus]
MGNLLIFAVTALDQSLHTIMYFFLRLFLVVLFAASELSLLTAMSYDRYVAICRRLHYEVLLDRRACGKMATASWFIGGLFGAMYTAGTFSLSFCGLHEVQQFFCDVHSSWPASGSRAKAFSTCLPHLIVITTFLCTAVSSYLKPMSDSSSTLEPQVSVVYTMGHRRPRVLRKNGCCLLAQRTGLFGAMYTAGPFSLGFCRLHEAQHFFCNVRFLLKVSHLLVSVYYTVLAPFLNPLIYILRTRDMEVALGRILRGHPFLHFHTLP